MSQSMIEPYMPTVLDSKILPTICMTCTNTYYNGNAVSKERARIQRLSYRTIGFRGCWRLYSAIPNPSDQCGLQQKNYGKTVGTSCRAWIYKRSAKHNILPFCTESKQLVYKILRHYHNRIQLLWHHVNWRAGRAIRDYIYSMCVLSHKRYPQTNRVKIIFLAAAFYYSTVARWYIYIRV